MDETNKKRALVATDVSNSGTKVVFKKFTVSLKNATLAIAGSDLKEMVQTILENYNKKPKNEKQE